MGSPLRLELVGLDGVRAACGWDAVSASIEETEQALSRFRSTSDLVALNERAGDPHPHPVHRRLHAAVVAAERAWRRTGGAFDPRILADLERLGYPGAPRGGADARGGRADADGGGIGTLAPDPARRPADAAGTTPERGRVFTDGRWLHHDPRRRALAVAAPLDLGGIGKGLALRWAFATLETEIHRLADPGFGALLEAGGDVVARGAAPQEGPWLVAVEDPASATEVAVITLAEGAVCTSSIGVHEWMTSEGRRAHHLLDPRTGQPGGADLASVTVAAADPAWAETWSKTLFLAGRRAIASRARSEGLAAWWIATDGTLEMTPAARPRTAWIATEA